MSSTDAFVRILVTGGEGFVGRHLVRALSAGLPPRYEIIAGTHGQPQAEVEARRVPLDVTNADQVRSVLLETRPTHLFHLAAIAAIGAATRDVRQTWAVNFGGTLNLALAVAEALPDCRLLYCSSAQVYGSGPKPGEPIGESAPFAPIDAYGASKAAADLMIEQMSKQGMRAIRLRPFNHTGPGQNDQFAAAAFAAQIARIERGEQEPVIHVGALTSRRDFLDVRDVVDGYVRAVLRFDHLPPGSALNFASGRAVAIGDILNMLLAMSARKIEIRQDPSRVRGSEVSSVVGDASLAQRLLDWTPRTPIETTLAALLADYRSR